MNSTLIIILITNMTAFLKNFSNKLTERQKITLEKIILCNSKKLGLKMVYCPTCNEEKMIYFSCKSGYCPYCGRNANKIFVDKFVDRMLPVTHRHLTMTMSSKLWNVFFENIELRKKLLKTAFSTVEKTMFIFTGKKLIPGGLVVIHTYGKDLKTNCHVHLIVTEGGYIKGTNEWVPFTYFPFEKRGKVWKTMNQIWMDEVLKLLEDFLPKTDSNRRFIEYFKRTYKNGFYIYGPTEERIKTNKSKRTKAKYITRYVKHPVISDYRILTHNEKEVTFWYNAQFGGRITMQMNTLEFMFNVIKHIPLKNFRLVNFYGIYANSHKSGVEYVQTAFDYDGNIVDPTDLIKDGIKPKTRCPVCKSECLDVYLILYEREEITYRIVTLVPFHIISELPGGTFYYQSEVELGNQLTEVITSLHAESNEKYHQLKLF